MVAPQLLSSIPEKVRSEGIAQDKELTGSSRSRGPIRITQSITELILRRSSFTPRWKQLYIAA